MLDYDGIKALARNVGRPVKDLVALSRNSDPFFITDSRRKAAEWFAMVWREHGGPGSYLRRIHYRISTGEGIRVLLPGGRQYQNTKSDWQELKAASLTARYLDLIPPDALIDNRNDHPIIHAENIDPQQELEAHCGGVE